MRSHMKYVSFWILAVFCPVLITCGVALVRREQYLDGWSSIIFGVVCLADWFFQTRNKK
jgi:hypothetical protein